MHIFKSAIPELCATCKLGNLKPYKYEFENLEGIKQSIYLPGVFCNDLPGGSSDPQHPACHKWVGVGLIANSYRKRFLEGYGVKL